MSDLEDEIEMILGIYSDECIRTADDQDQSEQNSSTKYSIAVYLPFHFQLQIVLPPLSYPDESYPQLFLLSSPNAQLASTFMAEMQKRMKREVPLGVPCLAMVIPLAQTVAEELQATQEEAARELQAQQEMVGELLAKAHETLVTSAIPIWSGETITDRRSKFIAHMAPVSSVDDVHEVVATLRQQKHIAIAAHPTIWAYRFTDANGVVHQNSDDDGEKGASTRMMFLLDQLKVDGYVVVVTRWFGGTLLGPDRFKHIMEVTKNMLLTIPEREKELKRKQKA